VAELLEEAECLRLILPGGIGRLAYSRPDGPVVLPVNYKLHEGNERAGRRSGGSP
jgi:nitroimidazol reductase NimA-like FMN-containing flavoprotein (pyridoxamine 5'-phosphate oxidase superfamily)